MFRLTCIQRGGRLRARPCAHVQTPFSEGRQIARYQESDGRLKCVIATNPISHSFSALRYLCLNKFHPGAKWPRSRTQGGSAKALRLG